MVLTKPVSVPVVAGMREDVSQHLAALGTLSYAKNVRFPIQGEAHARCGTRALSVATDADVSYEDIGEPPAYLAPAPGGFLVGAEGFGFRYDAAKARLHTGGSYANAEPLGVLATIAHEEQGGVTPRPYPVSQAARNGYVCIVYSAGASLLSDRIEALVYTEAGVLVTSIAIVAIAAFVVPDGSSSTNFILVTQSATTALEARVITTSATGATIGAAVSVGTLLASTAYWAVCEFPALGWLLSHKTAAGVITITAFAALASFDSQTIPVNVTTDKVSIFASATHVYAGWKDGVGTFNSQASVFDTSLNLTSGGTVTLATEAIGDYIGPPLFGSTIVAGRALYTISRFASPAFDETLWSYVGTLTAAGVATPFTDIDQAVPASAPFGPGYLWVVAGAGKGTDLLETRSLLLDFMGSRMSGASATFAASSPVIALAGNIGAIGSSAVAWGLYRQHLATPVQLSDGSWLVGLPRKVREDESTALNVAEWLRFRIGGPRSCHVFGSEALVAGWLTLARSNAGTRQYEGSTDSQLMRGGLDVGFPVYPSIGTPPVGVIGSGALTASGAYQWRAVLERIDYNGTRWRSAPSPVALLTLTGGQNTVELVAYANPAWLRANAPDTKRLDSQFVMHFYRTTNGGATFHRCTPATGAPIVISGSSYFFTDTASDDEISEREALYTDGGVLGNDAPPACRFVAVSEDRVWLAGLWETEQLQSSKILVPGEPPQFSDLPTFRAVLPEPCTGIAIQDGVLVAFAKGAIYALQGSGPTDQGQGAWDTPRCITRSTGCVSHLSILVTSVGVLFQSRRGIELLPRGLGEPVFVGAGIQSSFDPATTTIESAAVVTSDNSRTARFCTGVGVFTLDLDAMAWTYDEYTSRSVVAICDTDDGAVMALSDVSAGGYGFLREETSLDQDSVGDTPAEIACALTWAAIHPFTIAGWGRFNDAVAMFDEGTGFRSVNCSLFVDVDSPATPDPGFIFNMNTLGSPDYRKHVQKQVDGTAVKLRITTVGAGWRCMGWTLDIDDHGGSRRMAATEQG